MRVVRSVLVWLTVLMAAGAAAAQPAEPVLRIETGTHTARMPAAAVDAAGHVMVTAGEDKTARIWSLPELRPLGVLRVPIGPADAGRLEAVAVSPDGKLAAVGGTLVQAGDSTGVQLFDLRTRQVVRAFGRLAQAADGLAFSADGQRLAAVLDVGGVRVWNVADGSQVFSDTAYGDRSYGVAFTPDGGLITCSTDGFIRLYDGGGHLSKKQPSSIGKQPFRCALSADGAQLAIGFYDVAAVEIRNGHTLELLARPDVSGLDATELARVTWSADGRTLYAGGDARVNGAVVTVAWGDRGRGKRVVAGPGYQNASSDPLALPGGGFISTSLSGDLAVIAPNGRVAAELHPTAADLATAVEPGDASRHFLVSPDGRRVAWVQYGANGRWDVADSRGFSLTTAAAPPGDLADWQASAGALTVTDWSDRPDPKLNGRLGLVLPGELARAVSVQPGHILVGSSGAVSLFDASKPLWRQTSPNTTWRVNQSGDGRLAVAAFGDGTVRWWRMRDGQELLAVFLTRDAQRWVAFTPSGYYTASPGGEDLIGWHLNRGPDQAADFFPASQFRDRFYRPDVVTRVLDTLDEAEALKQADAARGVRVQPAAPLRQDLPPVINIVSPADGSTVTGGEATIAYSVRSPSGQALRPVRVLIDGRPAPAARGLGRADPGAVAGETRGEVVVAVPAGKGVEVALLAETATRVSEPARVRLSRAVSAAAAATPASRAATPAPVHRAALYALVIGVADYKDAGLRLEYSGKDARDFAALLRRNAGGLYREVQVKLLADHDATRDAVLDGLDWLRTQTTAEDVAVLFMAGHGTNDPTGRFYFLPYDTEVKRLRATAVAGSEVKDALSATPGRVVAFLDTCHSGSVLGGNFRGLPDIDGLSNELASTENGLIVFASSTGRESSRELPEQRNGAFTAALLEGLSGKADSEHTGAVTIEDLNFFVLHRVKELTGGEQHPNMLRPQSIRDFPLLAVGR